MEIKLFQYKIREICVNTFWVLRVLLNALMSFSALVRRDQLSDAFAAHFFMNEKPARSHGGQEALCVSQNQHEVSIFFLRCFSLLAIEKCDPKRPYMTMTCLIFFFRMWLGCLIFPKKTLYYVTTMTVPGWGEEAVHDNRARERKTRNGK